MNDDNESLTLEWFSSEFKTGSSHFLELPGDILVYFDKRGFVDFDTNDESAFFVARTRGQVRRMIQLLREQQ